MKKSYSIFVWLSVLLIAACGATVTQAASVGASGHTNAFSTQPAVADWATYSITGGGTDYGSAAAVDGGVQSVAASSITSAVVSDAGNPPTQNALGLWSSSGLYLATRPTGNAATLLLCKLVNGFGADAAGVIVSYDQQTGTGGTADQVPGLRAFHSLTGAAGSWVNIPQFSSAADGTLTATLNLTWPSGSTLHLVWADDNADGGTDNEIRIDNFSARLPLQIPVTLTSQPQSLTVDELKPATFIVGAQGYPDPTFQWYTNDTPIPGATSASYSIPVVPLTYEGLRFHAVAQNVASNVSYSVTSAVAVLTVNADTVAPVLMGAQASGQNLVFASFSEWLAVAGVTNVANYSITGFSGSLVISNAILDASLTNVLISVSTMTAGETYTLTVNGLTDQSAAANLLAPDSQAQFTVSSLASVDIGNPVRPGSSVIVPGGYDVIGGGTNIGGVSDQFQFVYQPQAGDFDVRVRVAGLSLSDVWAKAGLMARESLTAPSRYAACFATPSISGDFFQYRSTDGGATFTLGSFPATYPNTWLRLQRAGNVFNGYVSLDGNAWARLGSVTMTLPTSLYVGMAVTGGMTNQTTTAQFREIGDVFNAPPPVSLSLPREPLGPSSRRTGLIISEIMYHPRPLQTQPAQALEFVEVFNSNPFFEDLSGYRIAGNVDYTFPTNTVLPGGAFVVVARDPAALQNASGITGVLGPWRGAATNALPDDSGRVRLRHRAGAILLEVNYRGGGQWPLAADGSGHSLVLARPSYGEDDPRAWTASDQIGGSPGRDEPFSSDPLRSVTINEFLANSEPPLEDFIELYNHSNQEVDLSGAWLSDDRDTNKFQITAGTRIGARGFKVFYETELGFALDALGERIYLVSPDQTRVVEAVDFRGQAPNVTSGRFPEGSPGFCELSSRTPGEANSSVLLRDVVINELMFHPISEASDHEYVELYNRGTNTVDLADWKFTAGINFAFASGTVIPPGGYLVVARDAALLRSRYTQLNTNNTVGDYSGSLDNGGERVALSAPEYIPTTNGIVTNYFVVSEVSYVDAGRWSRWADGGGSSLELIDPNSDHRLMANWGDSDETAKAPWTNVVYSGLTDNGYMRDANGNLLNEIQVMIFGAGEALIDDVDVHAGTTGPNLVLNPSFQTTPPLTNWLIQGNHVASRLEPVGPSNPSQCLRVVASAGGDNGANRVECDLSSALAANITATIAAKLRWLRGHQDVLLRVHGGALEVLATLPTPTNLGTPGQRNSRALANAGPAIYEVSHSPVTPAANEPVVVTARVGDLDGIASVELRYRLDPSATLSSVTMVDNGTGGDAVAGDGVFAGIVPGQAGGATIAFRITASDTQAPAGSTLFPPDAPKRECIVRFGDLTYYGSFPAYRMWMTASNYNTWRDRERLSNEPADGTFVYGNIRAIYSGGARYRGSPFTRNPGSPVATGANYVWSLPEDDLFLGSDELNLDSLEPTGRDSTALRELTSFTFADQLGIPFSYQRFVRPVINGTASGSPVYTDSQQPNGDYIQSWFPDNNDGDLFKIDDWFEFSDIVPPPNGTGMQGNKCASLENFTTPVGPTDQPGGVKKKARYRWNWEKKFNGGLDDDYSSLYAVVDALNAPDATYVSAVESVIEAREWITAIALRHAVGDWDGYGYRRGKNQFTFCPRNGKFWMLLWDLDFSIGCSGGDGAGVNLYQVSLDGATGQNHMPEMNRMLNINPYFRRMYLSAFARIATGPMQDAAFAPLLDARYRALMANGVTGLTSPYTAGVPGWIQSARNALFTQVGALTNMAFSVASPAEVTTNVNLITITGGAFLPVGSVKVTVNGQEVPVTWTGPIATPTNWSARMFLQTGTNEVVVQGFDIAGAPLPSTSRTVRVNFTGEPLEPQGNVVISEIMYQPVSPNASFVEIHNLATSHYFDLSGWRFDGLGFVFPNGTALAPASYLVLTKNVAAYNSAYPGARAAFGVFSEQLDPEGETITLVKTGATPIDDVVVDKVHYEPGAPWPATVPGVGLQLIDPTVDNARASAWSDGSGWRLVSLTGTVATNATNFLIFLQQAGDVYIDDILLVPGREPGVGESLVRNGDFEGLEGPLTDPWGYTLGTSNIVTTNVTYVTNESVITTNTIKVTNYVHYLAATNLTNSVISGERVRSGKASLHMVSTGVGTVARSIAQAITSPPTNTPYTLSFWFYASASNATLVARTLGGSAMTTNLSVRATTFTPGAVNSTAAPLPPYPLVWLNEVQPRNVNGPTDNAGERAPWIELFNSGPDVVALEDFYLASSYTNLTEWRFPAGAVIQPGQFLLVWADGEPGESTGTEWHTSFNLDQGGSGSVALVRLVNEEPQVMDYLNFSGLTQDQSYGDYPDGEPFDRRVFRRATPGEANVVPPVTVFINEWLAGNVDPGGYPDPVDGHFEDWFELYNAGADDADLSGMYLTDNLSQKTQWRVPDGTVIPAGGFRLVWADDELAQNGQGPYGDLHAPFNLRASGEVIGLFAVVGTNLVQIDVVSFSAQIDNVSEGRYPDGAQARQFMTTLTPRAPNVPGNTRPTLDPIPNAVVWVGQPVTFTATASDPDVPSQTLTFSLTAFPPLGAFIDPGTGVFQWTPAESGAYPVSVMVSDDGAPALSATQPFVVYALSSQAYISPPSETGDISVTFPTVPGKRYRVDYTDDLAQAGWMILQDEVLAVGVSLTITDNTSASPQRFYRIVPLD